LTSLKLTLRTQLKSRSKLLAIAALTSLVALRLRLRPGKWAVKEGPARHVLPRAVALPSRLTRRAVVASAGLQRRWWYGLLHFATSISSDDC
jgi:hypothetical protein